MIVIEGADGTGKSTLAGQISERLHSWAVYPFGVPQKPVIEEYLHWLIECPSNRVICDRFHLGEDVYGPIWRNQGLDPHLRSVIELALMARGAILIHVTGPAVEVARSLEARGDELVKPIEVAGLLRAFTEVCRTSQLPRVTYNRFAGDTIDTIFPSMLDSAERRARVNLYRELFPDMPGIGNVREPLVAYVGECPNPNTVGLTRGIPFAHGPAGEHLIDAIARLGLMQLCYLTNAVKENGDDELVGQELRHLLPRRVIALGKRASAVLSKHRIAHSLAIHPMHARRFHFRTMDYAEHLAGVMDP